MLSLVIVAAATLSSEIPHVEAASVDKGTAFPELVKKKTTKLKWGEPFLSPQERQRSTHCRDHLPNCSKLGSELWNLEGLCRYPLAELCMATCRQCHRISAAEKCGSSIHCVGPFCGKGRFDWNQYFEDVLRSPEAPLGSRFLSREPPLIELPNFLSDSEADLLTEIVLKSGLEPEDDLPKETRDVQKADCESNSCKMEPFVQEIYRRVSSLLGLPSQNFESMEFLKYGPGQHYVPHPDAGTIDAEPPSMRGAGLRVMTVFFYLSNVEKGGETAFPKANLKVLPEKGKIVIWANVLENIWKPRGSAEHAALPVKKGLKIAANFWVHPFDLRAPESYAEGLCG
eukprot:TRINITY_DN8359_c0_g4_i1.p1 TRINITY_DN8359_c0_g4~~TRINITY_DN8359_c0_g4_i1.p1  ORF type:complete len:342 (-),score=49.89 TRINITY_DN8359_c0_g4_i1:280-1305(-)